MSLVQTYRAEVAERQSRQFLVYLALAFGVHALGAAVFLIWRPLHPQTAKTPTPLEFVYVKPQKSAPPPNPQARQAQTNATAGGTRDPNRPIQTASRPSPSAETSVPSSSVAPPPAPPLARTIPAEPAALLAPAQSAARPTPRSPVPAAPNPEPSQRPVASPVTSPPVTRPSAPRPSPTSSYAAQLGNPAVSVEQGAAAQLNPNRTATGASVDAVQNDLWGGYLAALNHTVEQNWRQVSVAATSRTRVQFRVDRQGQVTGLQILEPSGNTLADQAAMQAVQAAAPFAPLPQNATEDTLIVNFTFTQWLNPDSQ